MSNRIVRDKSQSDNGILTAVHDSIDDIERFLLNISILEDQIRLEKDRLPKLFARLFKNTPLKKVPELFRDLYWSNPHVGSLVKKTFYKVVGGVAPSTAKEFSYNCKVCEKEIIITCSCWSNKKESDKEQSGRHGRWWRRNKLICSTCLKQIKSEQAEKQAKWNRQFNKERRQQQKYREYLRTCPYPDFLASNHWQDVRSKALRRADYRCQLCNAKTILHVHHRTYEHRGWEHLYPKDLIVLCKNCHEKHHDILPDFDGDVR